MAIAGAKIDADAEAWLMDWGRRLMTTDWPREVAMDLSQPRWRGQQFERVRLQLTSTVAGEAVTARHLVVKSEGPAGDTVLLELSRDRLGDRATSRLKLDAQAAPLASVWLGHLLPNLRGLAPQTFSGEIDLASDGTSTSGHLRGELCGMSLAPLLGDGASVTDARLVFDSLEFADGRMTAASGTLEAGAGELSAETVGRLAQFILVRPQPETTGRPLAFDRLATRFELNSEGLTLWGDRPGMPSGSLVAAEGRALLLEPSFTNLPLNLIARFAASQSVDAIPVDAASIEVARQLPIVPSGGTRR
jgi:hypothetical protein